MTVAYLLSLPAGWKSYRDHERKAAAAQAVPPAGDATPSNPASPFVPTVVEPDQDDRPARLN
jgi:CDP-diacylglycerol---serine O-phosphatidyltransferase